MSHNLNQKHIQNCESRRKFTTRRTKSCDNPQVKQNCLPCFFLHWNGGTRRTENKTNKGKEILKYTQTYFAIFSKNTLNTF